MNSISKVSTKGQVVIPAAFRKKYHLKPGAQVQIFEYGNMVCITPVEEDPVEKAYGLLPRKPSLTEELLTMRDKDFVDG